MLFLYITPYNIELLREMYQIRYNLTFLNGIPV
jgi:hypothetical protein